MRRIKGTKRKPILLAFNVQKVFAGLSDDADVEEALERCRSLP